jgi:hypothetical protein
MIAAPQAPIPTHRSTMSNAEGLNLDEPIPYTLAPGEPVNEAPRAIAVEPVEMETYLATREAARILADAGFDGLVLINVDPATVATHLREAIRTASELLR